MKNIVLFAISLMLITIYLLSAAEKAQASGVEPERLPASFLIRRVVMPVWGGQTFATAIRQDRNGYIWMGTEEGLLRYDGRQFRHCVPASFPELAHAPVSTLQMDEKGGLWIGTSGAGLFYINTLDNDITVPSCRKIPLPDNFGAGFITAVLLGRGEMVWVGVRGEGVLRFKNGLFLDRLTTGQGLADNTIHCLAEDHRGNLWMGSAKGLTRLEYKSGSLGARTFTVRGGLPHNDVLCLLHDSSGMMLAGTAWGLAAFRNLTDDPDTLKILDVYLPGTPVYALHGGKNSMLFIAAGNGLHSLSPAPEGGRRQILTTFTERETAGQGLQLLFQDREDNVWTGGEAVGVLILTAPRVFHWACGSKPLLNDLTVLLKEESGIVWAGSRGGGLLRLEPGSGETGKRGLFPADGTMCSHRVYTKGEGLSDNRIQALAADGEGRLWVGGASGLNVIEKSGATARRVACGVDDPDIRALLRGEGDMLWIGGAGVGLLGLNIATGVVREFTLKDGLKSLFINCLVPAGDYTFWIGSDKGLDLFNGKTPGRVIRQDKSPNDVVYDIQPGLDNDWWLGGEKGLWRFKNGKWFAFPGEEHLLGRGIRKILISPNGSLWCASRRGISVVALPSLDQFERGLRDNLDICRYDGENGMPGGVSGTSQGGIWGTDGRPWFCTAAGLAVIEAAAGRTLKEEPEVYFEWVSAGEERLGPNEPLRLAEGAQRIGIHFSAPSFRAPGKIRFRYRLTGLDDKWREMGDAHEVYYPQLAPGHYVFDLTTGNAEGVWGNTRKSLAFTVEAPFFHGFWFYLGLALLITGGAFWRYLAPVMRQRRLEREEKYQASPLTALTLRSLSHRLTKAMEEEKLYLDAELTAEKLAAHLDMNQKSLSQAINQQLGLNFKNFLNRYRIEEAKRKLLDPREKDYVVLKIAMDCGFNSKSVFNDAFKKFTGLSPTQYREMNKKS